MVHYYIRLRGRRERLQSSFMAIDLHQKNKKKIANKKTHHLLGHEARREEQENFTAVSQFGTYIVDISYKVPINFCRISRNFYFFVALCIEWANYGYQKMLFERMKHQNGFSIWNCCAKKCHKKFTFLNWWIFWTQILAENCEMSRHNFFHSLISCEQMIDYHT